MNVASLTPGPELYLLGRQGFVGQNTSPSGWYRENGINPSNTRHCLIGSWNGPKAKDLRIRIIEALGILSSPFVEAFPHSKPDPVVSTEANEFFYWGC